MAKPKVAIMYDFDKTLCAYDMQNYGYLDSIKLSPTEFWGLTEEFTEKYKMDKILSYMYVMIEEAKKKGIKFTKEYLRGLGKSIVFFKGVETWFERINAYGEEQGVKIEHFVISSGIKEIIEGTDIAKEFKNIYACEYIYNEDKIAMWPKLVVNFTNKTQYIFRISKGVLDITDEVKLNQATPIEERRVQYSNMIYIGDGMTDIPCMQLVKDKGGKSIALYQKNHEEKVLPLVNDERINYVCLADYNEGSNLEKIVKLMIENMSLVCKLKEREQKGLDSFNDKINKKAE